MTTQELYENCRNKVYDGKGGVNFFDDLVAAFKLDANDPIVKRMYSLAWQNGHSAGYHEVVSHFSDLVEVFKGE